MSAFADVACTRCKGRFVLVTAAYTELSVIAGRFACASCGHCFDGEMDVPKGRNADLFSNQSRQEK